MYRHTYIKHIKDRYYDFFYCGNLQGIFLNINLENIFKKERKEE